MRRHHNDLIYQFLCEQHFGRHGHKNYPHAQSTLYYDLVLYTGPLASSQTVTQIISVVASPCVQVVQRTCTNTGLRFYEIYNPYGTTLFNPFYPDHQLSYFNSGNTSLTVSHIGYANNINFVLPWSGPSEIVSLPQCTNIPTALVFQSYFAPQISGT
ncbi:MAG: hypothetical protein EOO38_29995 [Cytophagaceae bacterium]|nr:MAG: hypothetical protein EOO38_29995 [Cytophagaceae bacterium]